MTIPLDLTQHIADYKSLLNTLPTTITYKPVVITTGDDGGDIRTVGESSVIQARIDEMGLNSQPVKAGILEPGDFLAAIPGDETIAEGGVVVANDETFRVVKISNRNTSIRTVLYLKKERPDV